MRVVISHKEQFQLEMLPGVGGIRSKPSWKGVTKYFRMRFGDGEGGVMSDMY